ncbi:MAG: hypothetical protein FWF23_03335 [Alphaproteobacteria bacterium]|nr:hypothetical protein [Alphaproteobacteria bacterium]MCL2505660.1 hypothetical protein [Alphaproteobacteria bacterium]
MGMIMDGIKGVGGAIKNTFSVGGLVGGAIGAAGGALTGAVGGAIMGIPGGPIGMLAGATTGALVGGTVGAIGGAVIGGNGTAMLKRQGGVLGAFGNMLSLKGLIGGIIGLIAGAVLGLGPMGMLAGAVLGAGLAGNSSNIMSYMSGNGWDPKKAGTAPVNNAVTGQSVPSLSPTVAPGQTVTRTNRNVRDLGIQQANNTNPGYTGSGTNPPVVTRNPWYTP